MHPMCLNKEQQFYNTKRKNETLQCFLLGAARVCCEKSFFLSFLFYRRLFISSVVFLLEFLIYNDFYCNFIFFQSILHIIEEKAQKDSDRFVYIDVGISL